MRRLSPKSALAAFPELLAGADAAGLIERWEAVLERAPRLRGYLEEEISRHRLRLQERSAAPADLARTLCDRLGRWLVEFEALPQFAVSAIATTLEEDGIVAAKAARDQSDAAELADPAVRSPEAAVADAEMLLADPVFALAFHCVDVRIRPQLASAAADAPEVAAVPEEVWFGLLHASAKPAALLTPEVAIALVLRVLGSAWMKLPGAARKAALRLFGASAADVRGAGEAARQLCDALPRAWGLSPAALPAFVAAAGRARVAASDASALCGRIAASVAATARVEGRGGFAVLCEQRADEAAAEELAEVEQSARKHAGIPGFRRLLALL